MTTTSRCVDPWFRSGVLVAVVLICASCTSTGTSARDDSGAGSCAIRVEFDDRIYSDVANVNFTVGEELGQGRMLPCDDTGGQGGDIGSVGEPREVFEVTGLDSAAAIAAGDSPRTAELFVREGEPLPEEVQEFIKDQRSATDRSSGSTTAGP